MSFQHKNETLLEISYLVSHFCKLDRPTRPTASEELRRWVKLPTKFCIFTFSFFLSLRQCRSPAYAHICSVCMKEIFPIFQTISFPVVVSWKLRGAFVWLAAASCCGFTITTFELLERTTAPALTDSSLETGKKCSAERKYISDKLIPYSTTFLTFFFCTRLLLFRWRCSLLTLQRFARATHSTSSGAPMNDIDSELEHERMSFFLVLFAAAAAALVGVSGVAWVLVSLLFGEAEFFVCFCFFFTDCCCHCRYEESEFLTRQFALPASQGRTTNVETSR